MSSAFTENRLLFARMATGLILDCGCGEGLYKDVFERRGETVGIDVKKECLVKSSYQNKLICSVTNLPFKDRIFDFVWACAIIEHVREDCIEEIIRVGKHIVFVTPNRYSPIDLLKRIVGKGWLSTPGHMRLYGVRELEKYGKVYEDGCGLPKRSFWIKFIPSYVWLFFLD